MEYNINALRREMFEANQKAVDASEAYNKEVERIVRRETGRAVERGTVDRVVINSIIRSIKEKSPRLEELANKQKFNSSEVVRISALLNGILAHEQLIRLGLPG